MLEISLNKTPNQKIFDVLQNENYKVDLLIFYNDIMYMNIYINDKAVLTNIPCIPNFFLMGFPYLMKTLNGDFMFQTRNDDYPIYENFGETCKLYFFTLKEIVG